MPASSFTYGIYVPLGLSLLTSLFVILPLAERIAGVKRVQLMTGVGEETYWWAHAVVDAGIYLTSVVIVTVILFATDDKGLFYRQEGPGMIIM